jgi:hypothetical protein
VTYLLGSIRNVRRGDLCAATVVQSDGVDLTAELRQ